MSLRFFNFRAISEDASPLGSVSALEPLPYVYIYGFSY